MKYRSISLVSCIKAPKRVGGAFSPPLPTISQSFVVSRDYSKKFPNSIHRSALRKLRMLNRSRNINDLQVPPGNRLESLEGDREGQMSIRINDQWRICYKWRENDVYNVEIVDYLEE